MATYSRDLRINKFSYKDDKKERWKREGIDNYLVVTKDIDFDQPSLRKKLYKVYVTFKATRGSYACPSGVKVSYALNGGSTFTEFDSSSTNYNPKREIFLANFTSANGVDGFVGTNYTLSRVATFDSEHDTLKSTLDSLSGSVYATLKKTNTDSDWKYNVKWGSSVRVKMKYHIVVNTKLDGFAIHSSSLGLAKWINEWSNIGHTANNTDTDNGMREEWHTLDVISTIPSHNNGDPDQFSIHLLDGNDSQPSITASTQDFYFKDIEYYSLEGLTNTESNIRSNSHDWVQAGLLFPSTDTDTKNAKSIKLKFEAMDGCRVAEGFEINDISIILRPKPAK